MSWEAVNARLEAAKARATEREREEERKKMEEDLEETPSLEEAEIYVDSDSNDSDTE